jgi:hypothetical protein
LERKPSCSTSGRLGNALSRKPLGLRISFCGRASVSAVRSPRRLRCASAVGHLWQTLHLWGAKEIATVEELIFSDRRTAACALPTRASTHSRRRGRKPLGLTPDRRRLIRAEVDRDIIYRLQSQSFVTISGIGELGKSTAAAVGAAEQPTR